MMDHQPILSSSDARLSGEREALGRREGITRRPDARPGDGQRPRVAGRFLSVGDDKLYVRGVTYGTFMPSVAGDDGYDPTRVDEDFARMVASGINAIRVYEVPPVWLLDAALRHGLWVSVDVPWEEHVAFLETDKMPESIIRRTGERVRSVAGHPDVLAFAVGNEIPSAIVRWHGRERIGDHIERLIDGARGADPDALVTYVNYPTTEYLRIRSVDFDSWNVYLEDTADFERYVARLQNLSPERPVVIAELGADSRRHGEAAQATLIEAEVRAAFAAGSAGTFVFAWTDEWARGGTQVVDWDFGITTRDRQSKPALVSLGAAYRDVPFPTATAWPAISVVLCSYNGAKVIGQCLDGLARQDYPDYEVIVIDDGSTDETAKIAGTYDVTLVSTPNQGLSAARNEGLALARGEIVAYIDDDAWPDRDWLRYLAWVYVTTDHVGVGGPNLPPAGDGRTARLVALAPGGPLHVLRTDTEAEHIPGCNSSFRTDRLRAIGGYDASFRTAGDDVDVCWRLQERGWTIGFAPGAMVWHHRRGTVRGYARQQRGYGFAEALLEQKWPGRFSPLGHVTWPGQLYGSGSGSGPFASTSVYGGTWGSAPYQSVYKRSSHWAAAPLMPEWWLAIGGLLAIGVLGVSWPTLWLAWAIAAVMGIASLTIAGVIALDRLDDVGREGGTAADAALLTWLVLRQSLARLRGRSAGGLVPWRRRRVTPPIAPRTHRLDDWSEEWHALEARLRAVEGRLVEQRLAVRRGGPTDRWDLEARTGTFASARLLGTVEEHGHGRQMSRWRAWPRLARVPIVGAIALAFLGSMAMISGASLAAGVLIALAAVVAIRALLDASEALSAITAAAGPQLADR